MTSKGVINFIWLLAPLEKTKEFIESGTVILDWEKEWVNEKIIKIAQLIKHLIMQFFESLDC